LNDLENWIVLKPIHGHYCLISATGKVFRVHQFLASFLTSCQSLGNAPMSEIRDIGAPSPCFRDWANRLTLDLKSSVTLLGTFPGRKIRVAHLTRVSAAA